MINLSENEINIIKDILKNHIYEGEVYIFGSRVRGNNKKFSDIDLAVNINRKLSLSEISAIKDDFDESDLIYTADIIDYNSISEEFKNIIDSNKKIIYKSN
ncbi:nucleotidyltransferase family protein [uncultured Brachyspira sp.]|uniref:nucleotidyltransferase family protein n=1 Tax=uncultured Brachyspira sp. TaxID=221953 RepID=UPI00263171FB|nr:nucleotidyltransferase domain-containing protein [uncultured Brachyspira sp.]